MNISHPITHKTTINNHTSSNYCHPKNHKFANNKQFYINTSNLHSNHKLHQAKQRYRQNNRYQQSVTTQQSDDNQTAILASNKLCSKQYQSLQFGIGINTVIKEQLSQQKFTQQVQQFHQNSNNLQQNSKIDKVHKERHRKISQQIAKLQLLNVSQLATPKLNKNKKKSRNTSHKISNEKQQTGNGQNKKKINEYNEDQYNHLRIHSNSLKQLNTLNKIAQSPSQSILKSSPDRFQKNKKISNFDMLKLHAQKLQKSNILLNSNIHLINPKQTIRSSKLQNYNNQLPHHKLDRLQINLLNKAKIQNGFKGSALISNQKNSTKYRRKSQLSYEVHQNNKIRTQTSFQVAKSTHYGRMMSNRAKNKFKNTHSNSFTNRPLLMHRKNNSVSSQFQDKEEEYAKNNQKIEKHLNQLKLQSEKKEQTSPEEVIRIQDETQYSKFRTAGSQRYQRIQTEPDEQLKNNQNQYLISKQFWPMESRSIIDKNRQNIKKINNIYSKIKSTVKTPILNNKQQKNVMMSNENIDQFIKTKLNLLQNVSFAMQNQRNMIKNSNKKSIMTCYSFYEKRPLRIQQNQQNNHKASKDNENVQIAKDEQKQKQTKKQNIITQKHSVKSECKSMSKTANRFYKPLVQKCKQKANLLISDPYLKTKAMQICPKDSKKSDQLVIICL